MHQIVFVFAIVDITTYVLNEWSIKANVPGRAYFDVSSFDT
jgi:hypothetical protein